MPQYSDEVLVLDVADKVGAHPLRKYPHIRGDSANTNQPSIPTSQLPAPVESGDSAVPRNPTSIAVYSARMTWNRPESHGCLEIPRICDYVAVQHD